MTAITVNAANTPSDEEIQRCLLAVVDALAELGRLVMEERTAGSRGDAGPAADMEITIGGDDRDLIDSITKEQMMESEK